MSGTSSLPRGIGKADEENDAPPDVEIDPDTFEVIVGGAKVEDVSAEIDGQAVERIRAVELPIVQRYFLS